MSKNEKETKKAPLKGVEKLKNLSNQVASAIAVLKEGDLSEGDYEYFERELNNMKRLSGWS